MAEQVEITNVGGNDGVASEATLVSLVASLQKMAARSGMDPASQEAKVKKIANKATQDSVVITRKNTAAEEENTKVTKQATGATAQFAKTVADASLGAIGDIVGSITNFGMELAFGGNRLSDFASSIPLVGGYLGELTGMVDRSIDAFRDVSQVGATFGDGLAGLRRAAADAAMPFDEFTSIVQQNSVMMQQFGGDVASGSMAFGAMAKQLRDGPGRALMNIGFTSGELNELLIDYAELQTRAFTRDRIQGRVTAASAAEFGHQLQELSAVTGKSREEILKSMKAQQDDVRIGAAAARMTADEFERFSLNIGTVSTMSQGLANALVDFDDGIPTNESTRRLMQFSDTFARYGQDVENMNPAQLEDFMLGVRRDLEAEAARMGVTVEEMTSRVPGLSDVFGLIGETAQLAAESEEERAERRARQADAMKANSGLMQFEETINRARSALTLAFIDSGVFELVESGLNTFAETIGTFTESDEFKATLTALSSVVSDMIERFKTFVTDIGKYDLKTALFGGEAVDKTTGETVQVEGLIQSMFGGAGDGAGSAIMSAVISGITGAIGAIFDFDITWDDVFVGGIAGLAALIAAPIIGIPGAITAAIVAVIGKDKLIELWTATWETIKGFFSFDTGEDAASYSIGNLASAAWETVTGWFGFTGEETTYNLSNLASAAWETVTGWFTMDAEGNYSILDIANNVWTSVTGWFSLADTKFSIIEDLTTMWNTVLGWFSLDTTEYSFSNVMSTLWDTVTGYFTFGEDAPTFSIQNIVQTAWDTVTGFFSFDGFEIPSIKDLFQSVIDTVKGFFDFDFELPSFKSLLPAWMGGGDGNVSATDSSITVDTSPATQGAEALLSTESALASFANLENLQNNLDILKNGLDVENVRSYTEAMEELVEVLGELNEELRADNKFGIGTGENAGSVLAKMDSIGSGGSSEELTAAIDRLAGIMSQNVVATRSVERNTRYGNTTDISRQLPS